VHDRTRMEKMLFAALVSCCLSLFGLSGCNDISKAPAPAPSTTTSPGVSGPLSISTSSLPAATVGLAYSATVEGSGGMPPYTWLVTPPLRPPGPLPVRHLLELSVRRAIPSYCKMMHSSRSQQSYHSLSMRRRWRLRPHHSRLALSIRCTLLRRWLRRGGFRPMPGR
jgi:hypothetical protein